MNNDERELGPIGYLVVEWPAGAQPNGEALGELVKLVDKGLVRVIDLAFVHKDDDGTVSGLALADVDHDGTLDVVEFEGASSGILAQDDYDEAGEVLEAGASAAILVYEDKWAAPFAGALRRNGAQLVASGHIPAQRLVDALDALDAAES